MRKHTWTYWAFVRLPLCFLLASVVLVTLLRWVPVRYTPLMLKRAFQFRSEASYRSEQKWVSLEEISPELIKAVVLCEDQKFYRHHGFDWAELKNMWQDYRQEGSPLRGCSTISQQTAKNVFTFGSRTYFRKASEAYWTCLIELVWGKDRIMEVYLNVVEMGRGLYGMQAATEHYYNCSVYDLSLPQSVALAVSLPSPLTSNPACPSMYDRNRRTQMMASLDK